MALAIRRCLGTCILAALALPGKLLLQIALSIPEVQHQASPTLRACFLRLFNAILSPLEFIFRHEYCSILDVGALAPG